MKEIPPMRSVHIIVVGNTKEQRFYFEELRSRLELRGYDFSENADQAILADEYDEYRFMTPDRPEKLLGLQVSDWEAKGTANGHPHFHEFCDAIDRRIF